MRKNTDCRQMSPEEKHAHRLAQKRASYARRIADPARRAALNAHARAQYEAEHGPRKKADLSGLTPEQRHARKLEKQRASRAALRAANPALVDKLRQIETTPKRRAQKAAWRKEHAADLNARRREDRKVNQPKFAAWQHDSRKRKREAKRAR